MRVCVYVCEKEREREFGSSKDVGGGTGHIE